MGGANVCELAINDNNDGTYEASYTSNDGGALELHIESQGAPIRGSPFSVSVREPSAMDAKATVPPSVVAGELSAFDVRMIDGSGTALWLSESSSLEFVVTTEDGNEAITKQILNTTDRHLYQVPQASPHQNICSVVTAHMRDGQSAMDMCNTGMAHRHGTQAWHIGMAHGHGT